VLIDWNRLVYIVFDYDEKPGTRRDADFARRRLAKELRAAGATEVYSVDLPPSPNGSKQGVDDFLVAHGAEAFRRLAAQAQPVPALDSFAPITKAEGRTDTANAARLVARYADVTRWVGPWDKWLIWDGCRWKMDQARAIDLKAKDIAADLFVEVAAVLKEDKE